MATCSNPVWIQKEGLFVRCGKCAACRQARARDWSTRLIHEAAMHDENLFVTFTYDPEHLPSDGGLDKRALQLAIKRARKYHESEGVRFRFFAVGEYGDKFFRPHYHMLVFGSGRADLFADAWPFGYTFCGKVEPASVRYVCKYVQKQLGGRLAKEVYGDREPPFSRMSKRLGKEYAEKNAEQLRKNRNVTVQGIEVGIPRYYRDLLDIDVSDQAEEAARKSFEAFLAKHGPVEAGRILPLERRQASRIIQHRLEIDKLQKESER